MHPIRFKPSSHVISFSILHSVDFMLLWRFNLIPIKRKLHKQSLVGKHNCMAQMEIKLDKSGLLKNFSLVF